MRLSLTWDLGAYDPWRYQYQYSPLLYLVWQTRLLFHDSPYEGDGIVRFCMANKFCLWPYIGDRSNPDLLQNRAANILSSIDRLFIPLSGNPGLPTDPAISWCQLSGLLMCLWFHEQSADGGSKPVQASKACDSGCIQLWQTWWQNAHSCGQAHRAHESGLC